MTLSTRYHVERINHHGDAFYLEYLMGNRMRWTRNGDHAFDYSTEDEANEDAERYGGEVIEIKRIGR